MLKYFGGGGVALLNKITACQFRSRVGESRLGRDGGWASCQQCQSNLNKWVVSAEGGRGGSVVVQRYGSMSGVKYRTAAGGGAQKTGESWNINHADSLPWLSLSRPFCPRLSWGEKCPISGTPSLVWEPRAHEFRVMHSDLGKGGSCIPSGNDTQTPHTCT